MLDLETLIEQAAAAEQLGTPFDSVIINGQTYDGIILDIQAVIQRLCAASPSIKTIFVDEAWGAWTYFEKSLREITTLAAGRAARDAGAQINVIATQSAHKSLRALRQASFLHFIADDALAHTKPQHGAIIMALMPLLTAMMTWAIKGQRPGTMTFICIGLALFGVVLAITGGDLGALTGGALGPTLLILAGAVCWVSYTIGASFVPGFSPVRYTALSAGLGSISIALSTAAATYLGFIETPSTATLLNVKWELLYLVLIAGVMAVFSWNAGIKLLGPVNGVLFINLVPVTAFLIGFVQGKQFGGAELLGCAITIAALVLNNIAVRQLLPAILRPQPQSGAAFAKAIR